MQTRYLLLLFCLVLAGLVIATVTVPSLVPAFFLNGTTNKPVVSTSPTTPVTTVPADLAGRLSITSTPPGAAVYLDTDAAPSGATPAVFTLSPITHPIMLRLSGYKDYVTSVRIPPGSLVSFYAELEPAEVSIKSMRICYSISPIISLRSVSICFFAYEAI